MATRQRKGYAAGDEVDSKCTKCKLVLAHVIVAMKGDKIARVQCNTCKGEHAYRPPPSASEATAAKRRAERKQTAADAVGARSSAAEFEALIKDKDTSKPAKYSMKIELHLEDIVEHPKFGVGIVTEIRESLKAHVAFKDGGRVLVHSRT